MTKSKESVIASPAASHDDLSTSPIKPKNYTIISLPIKGTLIDGIVDNRIGRGSIESISKRESLEDKRYSIGNVSYGKSIDSDSGDVGCATRDDDLEQMNVPSVILEEGDQWPCNNFEGLK